VTDIHNIYLHNAQSVSNKVDQRVLVKIGGEFLYIHATDSS